MNNSLRLTFRVPLLLAVMALCSCELPPRSAWQVIRTDGLDDYIAIEFGPRPVPAYVDTHRSTYLATSPAPSAASPEGRYLDSRPSAAAPAAPRKVVTVPAPPVSRSVASAPSVTAPRKSTPTVREEPVPSSAITVSPPPSITAPPASTSPAPSVLPEATTQAMAQAAKRAAMVTEPPAVTSKTEQSIAPAKTDVASAPSTTPKPTSPAAPTVSADEANALASVPFGIPVVGRPGLINSPYAAKHQLVDVTGMKAGEAIKCPFSGKLMRVPVAAQAASKTTEPANTPPVAPKVPASPKPASN